MSTPVFPHQTDDVLPVRPSPLVHRVFGEPCFHTDGDIAAVAFAADGTLYSIDESGVLRHWDAAGKQLMQKQMALGESFTLPADAQGPMLWTGRPDALAITVGGRQVPKLAEEERVMKDVPVTAAALLARGQPTPAPSATSTGENPARAAT